MSGYIKLWRKIEEWEWFSKGHMFKFFCWLMLRATHKETRYMGFELRRGQMIFGLDKASKATGIGVQSIRTYVDKLISTGEITRQLTPLFSIITINNFDSYQKSEFSPNTQTNTQTNNQLTPNQHPTNNIQECKNEKNEKKEIRPADSAFLEGLKSNASYKHIDLDREFGKMDAWLSLPKNKGRKKTPSFILNWLNKVEAPLPIAKQQKGPTLVGAEMYGKI